jgi:hypothetical protein
MSTLKESLQIVPKNLRLQRQDIMQIAALSQAIQMIQVLLSAALSKTHQLAGNPL